MESISENAVLIGPVAGHFDGHGCHGDVQGQWLFGECAIQYDERDFSRSELDNRAISQHESSRNDTTKGRSDETRSWHARFYFARVIPQKYWSILMGLMTRLFPRVINYSLTRTYRYYSGYSTFDDTEDLSIPSSCSLARPPCDKHAQYQDAAFLATHSDASQISGVMHPPRLTLRQSLTGEVRPSNLTGI